MGRCRQAGQPALSTGSGVLLAAVLERRGERVVHLHPALLPQLLRVPAYHAPGPLDAIER